MNYPNTIDAEAFVGFESSMIVSSRKVSEWDAQVESRGE